ncbi:MAG: hypothetical protein H8D96_18200 [Desulfobacterales bacterium]|uniref:Uncharacterized protein n=1 Tax=Candidatus Desulfatibia vada TaxID=2841696 RepID=A0A8J6P5F3_9BACT|nr:hypothetical protein [Candidatus Desulfatibia vada]
MAKLVLYLCPTKGCGELLFSEKLDEINSDIYGKTLIFTPERPKTCPECGLTFYQHECIRAEVNGK